MEEMLRDLIGTSIDLWSSAGDTEHVDHGVLEACNERWCRLREDDEIVLCFPISNIRLVKGRPPRKVGLPVPAGENG